jgi:hypothetical protein
MEVGSNEWSAWKFDILGLGFIVRETESGIHSRRGGHAGLILICIVF